MPSSFQIAGTKVVTMLPPFENTRLYEGHLVEAEFDFDVETGAFRKERLLDSTSMVMSPVDIAKIDFERFPKFADAAPEAFKCEIRPGDALYMPSFWWHGTYCDAVPSLAPRWPPLCPPSSTWLPRPRARSLQDQSRA